MLRAIVGEKPILPMIELEANRGGLTQAQVQERLLAVEHDGLYEKWGLAAEMKEWGFAQPSALELYDKIGHTKKMGIVYSANTVTDVSVGHDHSVALTANGDVFAWGRGLQGRLGLQDSVDDMAVPTVVPST